MGRKNGRTQAGRRVADGGRRLPFLTGDPGLEACLLAEDHDPRVEERCTLPCGEIQRRFRQFSQREVCATAAQEWMVVGEHRDQLLFTDERQLQILCFPGKPKTDEAEVELMSNQGFDLLGRVELAQPQFYLGHRLAEAPEQEGE